ncbi:DUF1648 domain-containing protein [Dokdonia genika]|uniref:DUF1648 domain-containing protein n=1 Tax=Dokdonia genika TaxID=308113 RepID=A0ABV9L8X1_9FLAO
MDIKKIFWILSWLVAGVTFAMILIHYGDIPDEVPMHFDATGVADRYGSKNELFILPALSVLLILLFQFMTGKSIKINKHKQGVKNEAQVTVTKTFMSQMALYCTLLFGWLVYQSMAVAVGKQTGLSSYFLVATFGGFIILLVLYYIQLKKVKE